MELKLIITYKDLNRDGSMISKRKEINVGQCRNVVYSRIYLMRMFVSQEDVESCFEKLLSVFLAKIQVDMLDRLDTGLQTHFLTSPPKWYVGCFLLMVFKCRRELNPAGNYILKVNKRNTRTRSEICSKLKIKTPERRPFHNELYYA